MKLPVPMKVPYLKEEQIERDAAALLTEYERARGVKIERAVPIDDIVCGPTGVADLGILEDRNQFHCERYSPLVSHDLREDRQSRSAAARQAD